MNLGQPRATPPNQNGTGGRSPNSPPAFGCGSATGRYTTLTLFAHTPHGQIADVLYACFRRRASCQSARTAFVLIREHLRRPNHVDDRGNEGAFAPSHLALSSRKRVNRLDATVRLFVVQIFAVENLAIGSLGRRNDQPVPVGELILIAGLDGTEDQDLVKSRNFLAATLHFRGHSVKKKIVQTGKPCMRGGCTCGECR